MVLDGFEVLLAHFTGTDGDRTYTANTGQVATFDAATGQIDTAQYKFSPSSLLLDGNSDFISFPHSADWDFGSGNFKIDAQCRFVSASAVQTIASQRGGTTDIAWTLYYDGVELVFQYSTNGTTNIDLYSLWVPTVNTWYHICVTKVGTTLRLFINGVKIGADKALTGTIFNSASPLYVGKTNIPSYQYYFNGWIDELHISKGGTSYETSNFTPPDSPYLAIPVLSTVAATDILYTQATLNGNMTSKGFGGNCTERGFDWGTSPGDYIYSWTETGIFETGTFNHIITELINGQTYYFRAKAYNSEGWGYGSELSFATLGYLVLAITTNAASNVAFDSVTLNGTLSNLNSGESAYVWFEYWKDSESGQSGSIIETVQVEKSVDGSFSANIIGLDSNILYNFRAKAILIDSGATEKEGTVLSFTTLAIDIKNIVVSQSIIDGKVNINYEVFANNFESSNNQLYIKFQYWNGSTWQECTTTTGEGLQTVTPSAWSALSGTWTAKTDIPETYYAATKIRILVSYDNVNWISEDSSNFALDVKNPIINSGTPNSATAQSLLRFPFSLDITDDSDTQIKIEISILDGVNFAPIITSDWIDGDTWTYYNDIRPLMYGIYYWRATVKDIYQNTAAVSSIYEFTLQDSNTEVRIDSIVKETTGSGIVKILYSIKDTNHEKISVRFDYTENDGDTYHPCEIVELSSGTIEDSCFITDLVATPTYVQYWARIQYSNDPEIQVVTDELKKRNLKISSKVYITRDGTDIDISNIVSSVDLSRSKQFGAAQLTTRCVDKDLSYNPNDITSANNIVSSLYNPLIYIGNIVKFSFKFLTASGIKTYNKFVGYINNVELSKNSVGKNSINITSQDYLQKLMNYMPENLEYKTTKMEIADELLKTFDGITYYAEFGSWAEYPAPIVKINNEILGYDKYIIDFVRGQIIYKGNTLSNLVMQTQICTNPLADRKTWVMNIATDNSIQPKVYYTYQKYENFTCNDYTGSYNAWVDYIEELHEADDYYVDYDEGIIYLYTALAADQTGTVVGNINNQKIIITYKETTTVTATYSYEIAGSNEVEDIIRDLSTLAGIPIANMKDIATEEDLIVRNENSLYTKYNNIYSLVLKRNGITLSSTTDYTLTTRDGTIELIDDDVNSKNKLIEDCDYLWDDAISTESGEIVLQEIDTTNKKEGTGSLKITFPTNGGYVLRDLIGDFYNCSITTQKYIEFWIKTNKTGTIYLDVSYNNTNWETKTINATTTWTKVQWDISAIASVYKDIKYLKIRGTDIVAWIDNIYIKRNLYTATYTYYTLQATGITLSKVTMDYENTENAFEAMQDLLKNVAPNYLCYFDDDNKLVGYYSNQRVLRNCVNCWNNFNEGNRGYSRSYYGEHYRLNLPTNLVHNISDEDVYTGCIVIGKNTEPQNVALKGMVTDDCTWIEGKSYSLGEIKTAKASYQQQFRDASIIFSFGNPVNQKSIFQKLNEQFSPILYGGEPTTLIDFDANTGYQWYAANNAPTPNILMCTLELETAILWDRVDILVGSYDGKVIKQAFYIMVGDETGTAWWYTEKNKLKVEGGASGSWITFENNFNQNIKIKYVRVYMSEPWNWTTTTTTSGGKGGGGSSSASTDYFYAFSLGEIEVWEKATLIGKRTLDNVLFIGDGVTDEVYIPNTPFKTKDYLEYRWGWINKYPETIRLWKNSFSTELIVDIDFTYDKTTGLITFLSIPAVGDVVCGTWTLDNLDPENTTFYASFANIHLIRRIGLKYYKEVDDGLWNHIQTINRAGEILPELSRSVFPGNIDIVYRPDIKLGQSVLVVNEELSLNRIFYVDSINLGVDGFIPKCSLGITSYLELEDFEYQEINPSMFKDWRIRYPKYLPAFASHSLLCPEENTYGLYAITQFFTGTLAVEALNDTGNTREDYTEPCVLEILTLEDSITFKLIENNIKAEMWVNGKAELNFYLQWNQDGLGTRAKTPTELIAEDKWYIDKVASFRFYEVNNPTKIKYFSTTIRLYLAGTLKGLAILGVLGELIAYDAYNITTTIATTAKEGKQFATDIYNITRELGNDSANIIDAIAVGQTTYILWHYGSNVYQIKYYDWASLSWINWGTTFANIGVITNIKGFSVGKFVLQGQYYYCWDGKNMLTANSYVGLNSIILNEYLYVMNNNTGYGIATRNRVNLKTGGVDFIYFGGSYEYNPIVSSFIYAGNVYFSFRWAYPGGSSYLSNISIYKINVADNTMSTIYYHKFSAVTTSAIGAPNYWFWYKNRLYCVMGVNISSVFPVALCEFDIVNKKFYRIAYLISMFYN